MKLLLPVLALLLTLGCSPGDELSVADGDNPTDTPMPTTPILEGWFSVDGDVDIVDGELLTGDLELSLWGQDVRGRPERICSAPVLVDAPPPTEGPEDEVEMFGMWQLDLMVDECIGAPSTLDLGIGPLPRELWPSVESNGDSMRHARGLYLRDRRTLLVFGFAGTQAQLDGRGAPTSLDPLPDGTYLLQTAFLLEL